MSAPKAFVLGSRGGTDNHIAGFRVLSEAERTAALYSLLQHSTQVQIRFFITVLQQMARSDPMTALLSPANGGSMQQQMESKLISIGLKSPGLKAPSSPTTRNFSGSSVPFLTPEAAVTSPNPEAAATLAQQRARLKASNADAASRRISAPGTLSNTGDRNVWQSPQLGQVAEREPSPIPEQGIPSPGPTSTVSSIRPKSTDFSVLTSQFGKSRNAVVTSDEHGADVLSPMGGGNWASMVNTPLVPMFANDPKPVNVEGANAKLSAWTKSSNGAGTGPSSNNGRIPLADPKTFRRSSKASGTNSEGTAVYGDDGNLLGGSNAPQNGRGGSSHRNVSGSGFGNQPWGGMPARSPALSNVSSNRFPTQEEMAAAAAGMQFGPMSMGMNPLMGGMGGMGGMMPGLGFMGLQGMMDPVQAQLLAAQIASGQFGQGGTWMNQGMGMAGRGGVRSTGLGGRGGPGSKPTSNNGRGDGGNKDKDEEVDPALLNDIPAWLRSLRLHKYTPNFEGMMWRDMVVMDEKALEDKGVAALGARRKMLKTFEAVRNKMGVSMPGEV
jgi:hypothetical protein